MAGGNVEILVGATAPVAAWLSTRGRLGERLAFAWNVLGCLSLLNVVARAMLTAPGPLHGIDAEVPNVALGLFPYSFIPGFMAPFAMLLHVLAFRAFAARRNPVRTVLERCPGIADAVIRSIELSRCCAFTDTGGFDEHQLTAATLPQPFGRGCGIACSPLKMRSRRRPRIFSDRRITRLETELATVRKELATPSCCRGRTTAP